ncbi:MAG: universal stress protein [Armatimonadota bacterium]|nr:universal stress protein [Armatimonadota bacterium]MDR7450558.1 universal stress protein [Armatimonadota bacterium]MDR7466309.1 universal stress protein [Armatimonadota bacterium]MDR7493030.1 universal stress protein [Armatimonadota bacterium]MDR7498213.1 universal stress protein [Armatimonadota bacterium]
MFRRLLVPLDGSPLAEAALPATLALARHLGAEITLFHAVERGAPVTIHGQRHLTAEAEAAAYLAEVASWLRAGGVAVRTHLDASTDDVAASIVSGGAEEAADLVVLCTHGRGGLRGLLFGRVAEQVLRRGQIPILLVRPTPAGREQPFACRRIMVPLDGSPTAEAALPAAVEIGRACDAELLLVMVVPTVQTISGERAASTRLMPTAAAALLDSEAADAVDYLQSTAAAKAVGARSQVLVERGEPVGTLLDVAARRAVDLIVMATHGRSGVDAMWAGSVAARIVGHSTRPVLLVRVPRR